MLCQQETQPIKKENVLAYIAKSEREKRKEIPVGIFNAKPTKQTAVIHNHHPMDTVRIADCYIKVADIWAMLKTRYWPIFSKKRIFAVQISGKYIVPKSALVEFLVGDFAFEIIHKSTWHMNTILLFVEKE